jgi:hypothetical protein
MLYDLSEKGREQRKSHIFGKRKQDIQIVVNKTSGGGFTINALALHASRFTYDGF